MSLVGQSRRFDLLPLLPVCLELRTFLAPVGMSQKCHEQTSTYGLSNERGRLLRRPPIQTANGTSRKLLLAVFLHVRLGSFVGVMPGVKRVCACPLAVCA